MSKKSSKQFKTDEGLFDSIFKEVIACEESERETDFASEKPSCSKASKPKKVKYSKLSRIETSKTRLVRNSEGSKRDFNDDERISKTLSLDDTVRKPSKNKNAVVLKDFTRQVVGIYQAKAIELVKKQVSEEKGLRAKFMNEVDKEMEKWKGDMNKAMEEEEKLVQMLQKHLKIMEKARNSANMRKKNLLKVAKDFEEKKEELAEKHDNETITTMESTKKEILELKMKILSDIQKKEVASIQQYLSTFEYV